LFTWLAIHPIKGEPVELDVNGTQRFWIRVTDGPNLICLIERSVSVRLAIVLPDGVDHLVENTSFLAPERNSTGYSDSKTLRHKLWVFRTVFI
jgi:hypothetical protein